MRTLNEVIEKYEICNRPDICCSECPFFRDICSCDPDALHYLKEYRETKKHLACLDATEVHGEDTQVVNNPPLTWEELKQMKGEPVWIVWDDGIWGQYWILIHRIDNFILSFIPLNDAITNYDGYLRKTDLGRTWNIYKEEIK